jgi:NMD protein affecting ribosome stability and mRNA decay
MYTEETLTMVCPNCKMTNHIIAAISDKVAENHSELVLCFKCSDELTTMNCWMVFAAKTAKESKTLLTHVLESQR